MHPKTWILAGALAGCGPLGNGEVTSETRTVDSFSMIDADNAVEVRLTVDASASGDVDLEVRAESNLLELLETEVVADTLRVDIQRSLRATEPMQVTGTVASVLRASGNNAAFISVDGVSGPTLDLLANNGAEVEAMGDVDDLMVDANNGAHVDAVDLTAARVTVDVNNGALAEICATDEVTGTVDNGADLVVSCGADTSDVTASNGGSITSE